MLCTMCTRHWLNTTEPQRQRAARAATAPYIASALGHHQERFPDDVFTCGDVDMCSRASWALPLNTFLVYSRNLVNIILCW